MFRTRDCAGLLAWLSSLRARIIDGAREAHSRARAARSHCNMSNLLHLASRQMKLEGWTFARFDKEAGVCVVSRATWERAHLLTLSSADYATPTLDLNFIVDAMRSSYSSVVKRIGRHFGDAALSRRLSRSLREEGRTHSCSLQLLVKSHKCPPTLRNIHSCPSAVSNH